MSRKIVTHRTNEGVFKAEGKTLGRKPVKPAVEQRIRALRAKGMGILKIGKTVGVGTSVVQRVIAAAS